MTPRVSVIMSVFNGEPYVRQAVDSILRQTFTDFEFIVIDDASTDDTFSMLVSYDDPRIRLLQNETNLGLTRSLNRGLEVAQGEYIARIDADDIAAPQKLEMQVAFLDTHLKVGLVGSWFYRSSETDGKSELIQTPTTNDELQQKMFYSVDFQHSAIMFRRLCVEHIGPYNLEFILAQDKDLWLRIAEHYEVAAIPAPLVTIRVVPTALSQTCQSRQAQFVIKAREAALQRRLTGKPLVPPTVETIGRYRLYRGCEAFSGGQLVVARRWVEEALETWPTLHEEADDIIKDLVYRAYHRWLAFNDNTNRWSAARNEAKRLEEMLRNLSPSANRLASTSRRSQAAFYIVVAFGSYAQGDFSLVRKSCLHGLLHDPRWLRNGGVISICLESLIGTWMMQRVRVLLRQLSGLPTNSRDDE